MDFEKLPDRIARFAYRMMGVKHRPNPRTSETPIFATFHDRLFASAIDIAIVFVLLGDVFRWISTGIYQGIDDQAFAPLPDEMRYAPIAQQTRLFVEQLFNSGFAELWLLNSFVQSLLIGFILVPIWWRCHSTPGKFVVGLRLAGGDGEGEPDLKAYIKRYLGFYLSMPVFMIGFAALGFDRKKRAWHDRIAGTTVIYTKEGSIIRRAWDALKTGVKTLLKK